MFTVFLADDEFMILEGLKRLFDWEKAGFQVIGEANDGDEAFEAIKEYKPDIVLTDIRMSGLSGLELIRIAKEWGLFCKFIIISGYDDFSYCLEALRLGVSDYILKPIDFLTLGNKLEKVAKTISETKAEKEASSAILKIAEGAKRLKLERFLVATFTNSNEQNEIAANIDEEELPRQYYYCVCIAGSYDGSNLTLVKKEYLDSADYLYCMMLNGMIIYVLGFKRKSGTLNRIREFEMRLRLDVEAVTSVRIAVGFGALCKHENISLSFRQAFNIVEHEVFYQDPVDCFQSGQFTDNRSEIGEKAKISNIINAIKLADTGKTEEALNKLFSFIMENRIPKSKVESILKEISVLIGNIFYELENEYQDLKTNRSEGNISNIKIPDLTTQCVKTLESFRKALKTLVQQAIESISQIYDNKMNPFTKVKEYINHHYMEDLSLKGLAYEFHMNPSYLSRLFKEKCYINYSDYLNMVRIEKAKKLLVSTALSINEISETVGFSDYRYFTKVFKKYQGTAPNAFKKNSSKAYNISLTGL